MYWIQPNDALKIVQDLIRLDPQDDHLFRKAGMIYLDEKDSPEVAQVYFQQSLSLNPDQPELLTMAQQGGQKKENGPELPNVPNPAASIPSAAPPNPQPTIPGLPTPQ